MFSISTFASLVDITIGIVSSTIGLKISVTAAGIKKYESIVKKKKNKLDKIELQSKSKLNSRWVLISKALIDLNISHDQFVLVNYVLNEFYDKKEKIKNSNNK